MDLIIPPEHYPHQTNSTEKAIKGGLPYRGLFHEQGTGKTLTTITILRNLFLKHRKPLKTLIFCPAIVVDNWAREIDQWSKCGKYVHKLQGTKKQRMKDIEESEALIFITNYEALHMDGLFWDEVGTKKKPLRKLKKLGFEVLILDESHRAKTHNSNTTKMLIRMSDKIHYRYILTGTPILNTASDIWSQYRILDGGERFGANFYAFRNLYYMDKNAGMPSDKHFPDFVLRMGALEAINEKIYTCADRVRKDEALTLPPLIKQSLFVDMSPEQSKAYKEMKAHFISYVEQVETGELKPAVAKIALTKALRLLQIVSGFVTTDDGEDVIFKKNPRIDGLKDILQDREGKIIIWATFKQNYKMISNLCDKLKISYGFLVGGQNPKKRASDLEEFTKGDIRVLIASPQAGGTGVNLIEASTSIWFSRNFSLEHRLQGLARNHRKGSEMHKTINSIDLVCPGSLEENVLESLDNKECLSNALLKVKNFLK